MSQPYSVTRSARTVSLAVLGSRVLGLVREQVLAALFGANREFDAFVTAFRIPNLLRDLFAEGALSAAFVTTFSQKLSAEGDKSAWRLANLVLNALILALAVITLVGILISPWLVRMISPGFSEIPGKVHLTTTLTRIMFPFLLMVALAALAMGMLNAKHRFGVPASASMMFNIGSVVGGVTFAFLLAPGFTHVPALAGRAVIGMSIGTLIGGALQWIIQVPSLRKVGYRYEPILVWHDPGFRQVLRLLGPSVIGTAAVQVNIFTDQWFASWPQMSGPSGSGAVSWLNCSFRLMQFPIGVFGVAIATATLPAISRSAALKDITEFRHTLAGSIRLAFLLTIPSAVGLIVLGRPIIALIYERGHFGPADTEHTAAALAFFAVGLTGYAAIKILAPAFYALGDARTPMIISLASMLTNFVMNWSLVNVMQERGLALSTSTVALGNCGLLYFIMRKRINGLEGRRTALAMAKILFASAAMGAACWAVSTGAARVLGNNFPARLAIVTVSVAVSVGLFYLVASLLGVEELRAATSALTG